MDEIEQCRIFLRRAHSNRLSWRGKLLVVALVLMALVALRVWGLGP